MSDTTRLSDCGCCEGVSAQTPARLSNRPGLSAIAYRIGTHAAFKRSALARLTGAALGAELTARDDDDFTIALLDAWAAVGDALTFYQERIANESYLRTARERLSLVEMARLIGYRPSPGVAAGVALAFAIEAAPASATTPSGAPLPSVPGVPESVRIPAGARAQSVPGPDETAQTFETGADLDARAAWNALKPRLTEPQTLAFGSRSVWLEGTDANLKPGDALLFVGAERIGNPGSERWDWRRVTRVTPDAANNRAKVEWGEPLGSVNPASQPAKLPKVYALRLRASLFGYNAVDPRLLHADTRTQFTSSLAGGDKTWKWNFTISGQTLYLDNAYPAVLKHSWLVLAKPSYQELYRASAVAESSVTLYAMAGKATKVDLDTDENLTLFDGDDYRDAAVFAHSEELPALAERPLPAGAVTGLASSLALSAPSEALPPGRLLIVEGLLEDGGALASETVTLDRAETAGGITTLRFATALKHSYVLSTVTLYANAVAATHGETVAETLGSGDGSRPYQSFTLKQAPLTHVADPRAAGGAASTLEIRINDIRWDEAPTLFGRGPRERLFVTRIADDGKVTVQFGDGRTGARLPSGAENLRATYRKGIGQAANVKAGQITTLLTRPLGAKGVINPAAAAGGADPETLADARRNAPLTVLTLDRIVSLQDYEDFARAYAGVAKALATWTWSGERRGVFVTVAGPGGAPIPAGGQTYDSLLSAMRLKGDPHVPLAVASHRPAAFQVNARLKVDPAYDAALVEAGVRAALLAAFSFDARAFAQPVTLSEVMAVMQAVAGVVAVDVDVLKRPGLAVDGLKQPLPAAAPQPDGAGGTLAAELLTIDANAIALASTELE